MKAIIKALLKSAVGREILRTLLQGLLKAFVKHLREKCERQYGYVGNPKQGLIQGSGGGPRFEYAANFLDEINDSDIKNFLEHEL